MAAFWPGIASSCPGSITWNICFTSRWKGRIHVTFMKYREVEYESYYVTLKLLLASLIHEASASYATCYNIKVSTQIVQVLSKL